MARKQLDPYTLRWVCAQLRKDVRAWRGNERFAVRLRVYSSALEAKVWQKALRSTAEKLGALTKTPKAARKRNG